MNVVSEKRNRTFLDMVQSMMSFSKLLISFWGYALETAACVLNVLPIKSIASTPYEIWKGKKMDFSYFRVWGCPTHVKKYDTDKLESRTKFCRFLGYSKETSRYYFYSFEEQLIFFAKRVVFLEDEYILRRDSESKVVLEEVPDPNTNATSLDENSVLENLQVHIEAQCMTGRVPRQPDRYVGHIVTDDVDTLHLKDIDPLTYSEAVHDSYWDLRSITFRNFDQNIKCSGKTLNQTFKIPSHQEQIIISSSMYEKTYLQGFLEGVLESIQVSSL